MGQAQKFENINIFLFLHCQHGWYCRQYIDEKVALEVATGDLFESSIFWRCSYEIENYFDAPANIIDPDEP